MPSAQQFLDAITGRLDGVNGRLDGVNGRLDGANTRLDDVKGKLDALKASTDAVKAAVDKMDQTLRDGFKALITLGIYTNQALYHNARQNDTIICILEHISKNTCDLVTQSTLQTGMQSSIKENMQLLAELFAATHAEAALTLARERALRERIERCCPPPPVEPACNYQPCEAPRERLEQPPRVDFRFPDR